MWEKQPNDEHFDLKFAKGTPLHDAVAELAAKADRTFESMEELTMGQIFALAKHEYGQLLPEFWVRWAEWNEPGQMDAMGDL
ncbi:hypothetical protein [Blastopirellula marina]|uniref:Uncharacterized protein n=2 Tax=Blastopirellula marina TaxID=124 RepID=A0A2S8F279_9BACT|nr:hypothetical protein [Blastopirellula marina]PQO26285.1 hypothetical protein C5Y98_31055 [Blastopirellula marina]PQO47164.1 hypothetical protein C5Y93_03745 [Blastopirellula marina]PTL40685.1 hypothetical protein C5Y97_31070 [Blastopirellula marina]